MAIDHEIGQLSRHIGQKTEEWRAGYCKLSLDLDERHLNRSGTVDGGIFAVMIDSAGAYAGTYPEAGQPKRDCATITMTINYAGQPQGKRLIAEGEMRRRIYFASCRVTDELGNLCAFGDCTFRIFTAG